MAALLVPRARPLPIPPKNRNRAAFSQPETQQGLRAPPGFLWVLEGGGTRGRITESRDAHRHLHPYVHRSNPQPPLWSAPTTH